MMSSRGMIGLMVFLLNFKHARGFLEKRYWFTLSLRSALRGWLVRTRLPLSLRFPV
jgi:hypothetical protein